jgi:hypothetical protein
MKSSGKAAVDPQARAGDECRLRTGEVGSPGGDLVASAQRCTAIMPFTFIPAIRSQSSAYFF